MIARSGVHFERRKVDSFERRKMDNFERRRVTHTVHAHTQEIHSAPQLWERWWRCSACVWMTAGKMMRWLCLCVCAGTWTLLSHPTPPCPTQLLVLEVIHFLVLKVSHWCSKWSGAQSYPLSVLKVNPLPDSKQRYVVNKNV